MTYDGKVFSDLESGTVEYRGREYRTWTLDVGLGYDVTFAEIALQDAMAEHGDLDCRLDQGIAYYADPGDDVGESVREYLE